MSVSFNKCCMVVDADCFSDTLVVKHITFITSYVCPCWNHTSFTHQIDLSQHTSVLVYTSFAHHIWNIIRLSVLESHWIHISDLSHHMSILARIMLKSKLKHPWSCSSISYYLSTHLAPTSHISPHTWHQPFLSLHTSDINHSYLSTHLAPTIHRPAAHCTAPGSNTAGQNWPILFEQLPRLSALDCVAGFPMPSMSYFFQCLISVCFGYFAGVPHAFLSYFCLKADVCSGYVTF